MSEGSGKMHVYSEYSSMFGVKKNGSKLIFTTHLPAGSRGYLRLYKKGAARPVCRISLDNCRIFGNVYEITVDNKEYNAQLYNYEIDGTEVTDAYAAGTTGAAGFGRNVKKRYGILPEGMDAFTEEFLREDKCPDTSFRDMVIYKLHVRGITRGCTDNEKRGTYAALAGKIPYFKELGVNCILLMPCVEFDETAVSVMNGAEHPINMLSGGKVKKEVMAYMPKEIQSYMKNVPCERKKYLNYWGYTKHSYSFAPKESYAYETDNCIIEFKKMVRSFHDNGISVFMELEFSDRLDMAGKIDCLRSWAVNYHIDGFRLKSEAVDAGVFLDDPVLSGTKLITDYVDVAKICHRNSEGCIRSSMERVAVYTETFKEKLRSFVKGDSYSAESAAEQFAGAGLVHERINFAADNNGYTLYDTYCYQQKHNEANGENNNDGCNNNLSWNCGIEGITSKKKIFELRKKLIKNALTGVFLSEGTPMLYAGDECLNSQSGNNNAYCQDNKTGWTNYHTDKNAEEISDYVKKLIELRKSNVMFRLPGGLRQMDYIALGCPDISVHGVSAWYADFETDERVIGFLRCGSYADVKGFENTPDSYVVYNMHWEDKVVDIPFTNDGGEWKLYLSTGDVKMYENGTAKLEGRSCAVFVST